MNTYMFAHNKYFFEDVGMKKILRTVSLLLMLNCTSSFAMTQEPYKDIWLEHLSEKNKFHVQVITKQAESCPIGLTSNGKKDYGMNFGMRFPYKHILESFPELIKNNTPEEPYKIYTFGCGSMPIFELHCILAGLYDGKQKIKVNMSDFQKEVIQKGSLFVFNALKKLKENDLKMPEIKDMYKNGKRIIQKG